MPRSKPAATPGPCPITRAELARRAGRGRSRITHDCRKGGPLEAASLLGGEIDVRHPAVAAWATARGIDLSRLEPTAGASAKDASLKGVPATAETAPLRSDEASRASFADWTFRKKKAEAERIELQNERDRGRLVSTELVRTHVFGYLDRLNRQLLGSVAQTLSQLIASQARAGATPEELRATAYQVFSRELRAASREATAGVKFAVRAARTNKELPEPDDDDRINQSSLSRPDRY